MITEEQTPASKPGNKFKERDCEEHSDLSRKVSNISKVLRKNIYNQRNSIKNCGQRIG